PVTLITAAESIPDVQVDSIRPYSGVLDTLLDLVLIDQVAVAHDDRLQILVDGIPRVLRVDWSTILVTSPQDHYRVILSQSALQTQASSAPWMPLDKPAVLDPDADWEPQIWRDMDTKLAAAPLVNTGKVLMLGRPGGPAFRPSEVARLGYLAGIVATVLG